MPTFTPPTKSYPIPDRHPNGEPVKDARFWAHYGAAIPVGYSVLITSGTATDSPGVISPTADQVAAADAGSGEGGKAWFRGGITYTVTSAESTALTTAGYTVT